VVLSQAENGPTFCVLRQKLHPKNQKNAEKTHQESIPVIRNFYFSQQATSDRK
jgi:hypothetical protein